MFNEIPTSDVGSKTLSYLLNIDYTYWAKLHLSYLTRTLVGDISVHNPVFQKSTLKTSSVL